MTDDKFPEPLTGQPALGGAENPSPFDRLPRRAQQAWRQYQWAIESRPDLGERSIDREVYDHLKGTLIGERSGFRLPYFDTWQRYLRYARSALDCRKLKPRRPRPHGSSIIHEDQN